jgi:hypothetical protein
MVEATPSISRYTPLTIAQRIATGSVVLAEYRACHMVKAELKRQGRRLCDVEHREIKALARDYLFEHPQLVFDARPVIEA